LEQKTVGKLIIWAAMALVGWSFYTTLQLDKQMPLINHRITEIEKKQDKR